MKVLGGPTTQPALPQTSGSCSTNSTQAHRRKLSHIGFVMSINNTVLNHLPPFTNDVALWFTHIDPLWPLDFTEEQKLCAGIGELPTDVTGLVQPTLIHPPATKKYTILKNGFLQALGKSRRCKLSNSPHLGLHSTGVNMCHRTKHQQNTCLSGKTPEKTLSRVRMTAPFLWCLVQTNSSR
ncbi:hypothetical protein Pcinc_020948 [Petrolisthes cinctipes]|uniref:Uncharacterized protein n=1 Tax=Petrolisthes cinctipes TaxID=88211 RepID=A0AAE1FHC6_PETCI|nr:hypothetical protein Pcinc_020948 [Petrolisthes cinctipes]